MKILKITMVNGEVYVDGVGQELFIGREHADLEDITICYGINIECEQIGNAANGIMKKFNLLSTAYKPLRFSILVAMQKARQK